MTHQDVPAREAMEFDVVIVGAGPAGLAAAIRLKQLAPEVSVVVVEKGSEVGAHILSGAVIDPIGLDRLLPDWRSEDTPIKTRGHRRPLLHARRQRAALRLPNFLMPPLMSNHGNYHRLARQRLPLARRPRPRRSASRSIRASPRAEVLYGDNGEVVGVATGDMGIGKDGEPQGQLHPRHGAARQVHAVRRRRARQSDQDS